MDDEGIDTKYRQPIRLYINSPGGDIYQGCALVDVMQSSKTPVITVNMGDCSSMAMGILIAGHMRVSLDHACFLWHDGGFGMYHSGNKFNDYADHFRGLQRQMKQLMLYCSDVTEEEYERHSKDEWFLSASEAKSYNLIDYIIGKDIDLEDVIGWDL